MDPSPFKAKDLDDDADEFIVSWAQEFPRKHPVSLIIHVNQLPSHADAQRLAEICCASLFGHRAKLNRPQFRHLLKEGTGGLFCASAISTKSFAACASKCGSGASKGQSTRWGRSGLTLAWMN
jgi:hypothetical protein